MSMRWNITQLYHTFRLCNTITANCMLEPWGLKNEKKQDRCKEKKKEWKQGSGCEEKQKKVRRWETWNSRPTQQRLKIYALDNCCSCPACCLLSCWLSQHISFISSYSLQHMKTEKMKSWDTVVHSLLSVKSFSQCSSFSIFSAPISWTLQGYKMVSCLLWMRTWIFYH